MEKCTAVTLRLGAACVQSCLCWDGGEARAAPTPRAQELDMRKKVDTAVCAGVWLQVSDSWIRWVGPSSVFETVSSKPTFPSLGTPQPRISLLNGG